MECIKLEKVALGIYLEKSSIYIATCDRFEIRKKRYVNHRQGGTYEGNEEFSACFTIHELVPCTNKHIDNSGTNGFNIEFDNMQYVLDFRRGGQCDMVKAKKEYSWEVLWETPYLHSLVYMWRDYHMEDLYTIPEHSLFMINSLFTYNFIDNCFKSEHFKDIVYEFVRKYY